MKVIVFSALLFLLIECGVIQKPPLVIEASGIPKELAQSLISPYLSYILDYDRGNKVRITRCSDLVSKPSCDFLITHSGNGCGWGSYLKKYCSDGSCIFKMTTYDEAVICE